MNEKEKNSNPYTASDIEQYLQGKLSAPEMHAIEQAALDDPFLADAIEGMQQALQNRGTASFGTDIADLKKRLQQRVARKKKLIPFGMTGGWWQIAAAVLVLLAGTLTYYYFRNSVKPQSIIAANKNKPAAPDSAHMPASAPAKTDSLAKEQSVAMQPVLHRRIHKTGSKNREPAYPTADTAAAGIVMNDRPARESETAKAPTASKEEKDKNNQRAANTFFAPAGRQNSFSGKVIDPHNNPIASASIELKDEKITAVTDHNGNFKLDLKAPDSIVDAKIVSPGYEPGFITLNNNGSPNIIILREVKNNLQEVAVSGNNRMKKTGMGQQLSQDAEPVKGWAEYNKYLEKNKKIPQDSLGLKGVVVVGFTVKKNGKPTAFTIEQSLGPDYDAEAIRLVKEGPLWKLRKGKKATITVTIVF